MSNLVNPYILGGLQDFSTLLAELVNLKNTSAIRISGANFFADSFVDSSGIDAPTSLNESYNSAGFYYEGALISSGPAVAVTFNNNNSQSGTTIKQIFIAAQFALSGDGVSLQLSSVSGISGTVNDMFIGQRATSGNAWDIVPGTNTRVTFSGSNSVTVPSSTGTITSDVIPFAFDKTKDYVIGINCGSSTTFANSNATTGSLFYSKAAVQEAGTDTPSGYTNSASRPNMLISQINVYKRAPSLTAANVVTGPPDVTGANWQSSTLRLVVSAAQISASGTGQCQLVLNADSASALPINNCYIQQAAASGNAYNYISTPIQVTFSASNSITIGAAATATSDPINLAIDNTKNYVITIEVGATGAEPSDTSVPSGFASYLKAGADGSTVLATGYTLNPSSRGFAFLKNLQLLTSVPLDLFTNGYTAGAVPSQANVVILYNPLGSPTLNTDLIAYASRDGSTYSPVTLTSGGASGITGFNYAYGNISVSGQPSGSTMKVRVLGQNAKAVRDGGIGASWA